MLLQFLSVYNLKAQPFLIKKISGGLSPKSIVHNGQGLFFAQNMIYNHTVTVFNRKLQLIKRISDRVPGSLLDSIFKGKFIKGSPVEVAFSHNGKYAWVSNYRMYGHGFNKTIYDTCRGQASCDNSFIYKINTETFVIEKAIKVGCVPKFLATSPNDKYLIVSNWCSGSISIVDIEKEESVKEISVGSYPRGIAIDSKSNYAYVSVMSSYHVTIINLSTFKVSGKIKCGQSPRHLNIDSKDQFLYATLNGENAICKIDLSRKKVISKISTGKNPRSMVLTPDDSLLYVVNYSSHTFSKIETSEMKILKTIKTETYPIGITYDPLDKNIWVSCYTGYICIYSEAPPSFTNKENEIDKKSVDIYTIVVGAFKEADNAEVFIGQLNTNEMEFFIDFDTTKEIFRVCCGKYKTKKETIIPLNSLKKLYPDSWVKRAVVQ